MEETSAPAVHLWQEPATRDPQTIEVFREQMGRGGVPHHLAKYDRGVYEFAVDVLDGLTAAQHGASALRRSRYQAAEQQLAFTMAVLDRELAAAGTGRLVRVVLHAERGALYAASVTPQSCVLGIVFGSMAPLRGMRPAARTGVPLVQEADICIGGLVNVLRGRLGLPDVNPGGLPTESSTPESRSGDERKTGGNHPPETRARDAKVPTSERLTDLLDPSGLVYLARCHQRSVVADANVFARAAAEAVWPVGDRRPELALRFYRGLAGECGLYAHQLGQIACQAVRGRLARIVLNVEQGAIYHYRLGPSDYLVGVTFNQSRVSEADERVRALAEDLVSEADAE